MMMMIRRVVVSILSSQVLFGTGARRSSYYFKSELSSRKQLS